MRIGKIRQFCKLQDEAQSLMRAAMTQLNLSARVYHRILKLARTIADLAGSEEIQSVHLAEMLQYSPKSMIGSVPMHPCLRSRHAREEMRQFSVRKLTLHHA